MSNEPSPAWPRRFNGVPGYGGRLNDVLYSPPLSQCKEQMVVVYFGGDIQDFIENMEADFDRRKYVQWSLENTAQILRKSFSDCHTTVIRPSRIEQKTFSCFNNFVPSGTYGIPQHIPMHNSLQHLKMLLKNISSEIACLSNKNEYLAAHSSLKEESSSTIVVLNKCHIKLIGFSKGCVVLNQFLHEFHILKELSPKDSEIMQFVSNIKDMYWLDGGHSGKKETWVTSSALLKTLSKLGIHIHIHLTPYQIEDEHRPWIKDEANLFYTTLCATGTKVQCIIHDGDGSELRDISTHFNVLNLFHKINFTKE